MRGYPGQSEAGAGIRDFAAPMDLGFLVVT
jgi:hypothetical protein